MVRLYANSVNIGKIAICPGLVKIFWRRVCWVMHNKQAMAEEMRVAVSCGSQFKKVHLISNKFWHQVNEIFQTNINEVGLSKFKQTSCRHP